MKKRSINLYLGLRINTLSVPEMCKKTENILNEIDKNNIKAKLAWNIACSPLLENDSKELNNLIFEIKTRIKTTGDVVIPIGYTGAIHPFLTDEELRKELEWSKVNLKQSGITDLFKTAPNMLFPIIPELNRKNAFDIYKSCGYKYIGIPQKPEHVNPFNIIDSESINLISFVEYYKNTDFNFIKLLKKKLNQQSNDLILMLCYRHSFYDSSGKDYEYISIIDILNELEKYFNITICSFNSIDAANKDLTQELSVYDLPGYPDIRKRGLNSIKYRKKNKDIEKMDFNIILNLFNPLNSIEDISESKPLENSFHNSRQNVSSMHGEVILSGNIFSISFLKGHFNGIIKQDKPVSVHKPSQSYVIVSGKKYKYKLLNAFSIEGDRTRGLRSNMLLTINQNNFNFISDFIFVEDFPYLIITSYIQYPEIGPEAILQQIAPIEIPLFYFNIQDKIDVTCIYFDDSNVKYSIDTKSDLHVLIGSTFYFQFGDTGIIFGFPLEREPLIGTVQIKIKKLKKRYLLSINPFGSYLSNDMKYFPGKKAIFSFYIGISNYCPKTIPIFPDYVLDEIPEGSVSNY